MNLEEDFEGDFKIEKNKSKSPETVVEEGLFASGGKKAYQDAFEVLSTVIVKIVYRNKTLLNGPRCIYYLKADINDQDFEKIKVAFAHINSKIEKMKLSDNLFSLIVTLDEKFRYFKD